MTFDEYVKNREIMNKKIMDNGTTNTKRFFNIDNAVYNDGEIPSKYKELMGLTGSMVLRCEGCIDYHIMRCVELGCSDKEIWEAFDIALIIGGSIVIPHLREAVKFLESARETKKEVKE